MNDSFSLISIYFTDIYLSIGNGSEGVNVNGDVNEETFANQSNTRSTPILVPRPGEDHVLGDEIVSSASTDFAEAGENWIGESNLSAPGSLINFILIFIWCNFYFFKF